MVHRHTWAFFYFYMYLLYIDASGTPKHSPNTSEPDIFATVGLCVHEGAWYAFEKRMAGLCRKYAFPGETPEIHAKDFYCKIAEQNEIPNFEQMDYPTRRKSVEALREIKLRRTVCKKKRRNKAKKFNATKHWTHLTESQRTNLYTETLDLVGSHKGIKLFGEVCNKSHYFNTKNISDAGVLNFTQVVSRFDGFLQRRNRLRWISTENGLLVMDNEPSHESIFRDLISEFRSTGHPWGNMKYVVESPFFVDSSTSFAIQAIDVCAYSLRRYILRGPEQGSLEESHFLKIYNLFDRDGNRMHGLRHYCAKGTCKCIICDQRGHARTRN